MVEVNAVSLASFLRDAQLLATEKGEAQLISWTKVIKAQSMLHLMKVTEALNESRLFWTNSEQDFILFGLGVAKQVIAKEDRYQELEDQWAQVIEKAHIYNPYNYIGTGLLAFGGMSFDPLRQRSDLWRHFPLGQLTVPHFLVTYTEGVYYLTVNQVVNADDDLDALLKYTEEIEALLQSSMSPPADSEGHRILAEHEIAPEQWKQSVQKAVETIQAGQADKIVLARELRLRLNQPVHISRLVEKLMENQPQSYIFAYEHAGDCFIGASPERLVQIEGDSLLSTCLAGTARRGRSQTEDELIALEELMNNPKNREEHDHVVQMIRSSIAPFCEQIQIPDEPVVLTLRNLQHLYTPVRAKIRREVTVFDFIKVLHPTPALGGVPTEKALAFMREEEELDRGWYGAPIGWIDYRYNSEFAVAIRSGLVQSDEISLFAGCGVMKDSTPEEEYKETSVKFLPMLTILEDHE